jgi:sugar/nucleoside kinase (ribokinase family)
MSFTISVNFTNVLEAINVGARMRPFLILRVSCMAKKKVVTIGGATQDIYLRYQGADSMKITGVHGEQSYMLFESGAKVEVEKVEYHTGGGATNSAVSFKRLGFDVSSICMIGDDEAGKSVIDDLEKEGVDTSAVVTTKKHSSGKSFVVNSPEGERTIFAYRGANRFLCDKDISFDLIDQADQLYITSLSHEASKFLEKICKRAKEKNVPVAVNPGISQLSAGASELSKCLKYIDILILNSSEAKTFMSSLIESDQRYKELFLYFSLPNFFKEVFKMGPKVVVVTDGSRGVYVATKEQELFKLALKVSVVDTLGAGDAFGSAFVGLLLHGASLEAALAGGIKNSASVIGKIGAKPGLLSHQEIGK